MRYISAYLLASMSAKHHVTAYDIENILASVGIDCETAIAEEMIKKMQGKTFDELIAEGSKYLCGMSGSSTTDVDIAPSAVAKPVDVKDSAVPTSGAESKKKEESDDDDLGFGLFD